MAAFVHRVYRMFNWDVVIRLALVPTVGYVVLGALRGAGHRAAVDDPGEVLRLVRSLTE